MIIDIDKNERTCRVKLNLKTLKLDFAQIIPPNDSTDSSSDLSSLESDDDCDGAADENSFSVVEVVQDSSNLGEWEKFTKGIGTKIMMKMMWNGHQGLGKRSDGRLLPVPAKIYIPGKSIDFNMQHGSGKTVEEKLKSESARREKQEAEAERRAAKADVFSFINNTLGTSSKATPQTPPAESKNVKEQTKKQLNVSIFQLDEDIRKCDKAIEKLKETLKRQTNESVASKITQQKISQEQKHLDALKRKQNEISKEQKTRQDKSKLTIF